MRANDIHKIVFTKEQAERGRERLKALQLDVSKTITEEAWKHFPELQRLDIENFLKLQQIISDSSQEVSFKINNLSNKIKFKQN